MARRARRRYYRDHGRDSSFQGLGACWTASAGPQRLQERLGSPGGYRGTPRNRRFRPSRSSPIRLHCAAPCGGRTRPHHRDSHRVRPRFSGQTRVGCEDRARYYHPGLQRFISEDPLGNETGEVNLYVYVGDDPINYVDPLGLDKENACTFSKRFRNNLRIIHDPIVRRPISFASGLLVSGEVARLTGVPTILQFARSGFAPIRGYVPIAQTIGLVGATAASLTVTQSAVVVGVVAVGKAVAVGVVLEAGIVTGAAINAAAVQPLLGPQLGITGCEGMK